MFLRFDKFFWQNKINLVTVLLAGFLNLVVWVLLYGKITPSAEVIPLHYNIYFGIDLIGKWYHVFKLPLVGLIILVVNIGLALFFYRREKLISLFLLLATDFMQMLLLVAAVCIVLINF